MRLLSRRDLLLSCLCSTASLPLMGCGTVLHPERRGQAAGPLDWKIVALDAVGLLFFFVPGVVAFAVDFSNGTIYLPEESYGTTDGGRRASKLREVQVSKAELSPSRIQDVVTEHVGRQVTLAPGDYETREIESIDKFWNASASFSDA